MIGRLIPDRKTTSCSRSLLVPRYELRKKRASRNDIFHPASCFGTGTPSLVRPAATIRCAQYASRTWTHTDDCGGHRYRGRRIGSRLAHDESPGHSSMRCDGPACEAPRLLRRPRRASGLVMASQGRDGASRAGKLEILKQAEARLRRGLNQARRALDAPQDRKRYDRSYEQKIVTRICHSFECRSAGPDIGRYRDAQFSQVARDSTAAAGTHDGRISRR